MSQPDTDDGTEAAELAEAVAHLTQTLDALEESLEPEHPPRPDLRSLSRFTSEVAIPALILLLRTNIQALELLRRALRMAERRADGGGDTTTKGVRTRAERLGESTINNLDGVLRELQDALEGRPADEEARELLDEARDLSTEVQDSLEGTSDTDTVPIDVDAELESLKRDVDDQEDVNR